MNNPPGGGSYTSEDCTGMQHHNLGYDGMTLLDYFAAKAMSGLMANRNYKGMPHAEIAQESFLQAHAMLVARENHHNSRRKLCAS